MGYAIACVLILVSVLISETVVYCASIPSSGHRDQTKPKGFGSAKRAIIIGVDGLGGSYLRNATDRYPTFRSFMEQGSYTTRARGIYPTVSGPNWSSYLTGMDVMGHGVFDNDYTLDNGDPVNETSYSIPPLTGRGRPETIFSQVKKKDPNLRTAMTFTWEWLKIYAVNNTDIDLWHWGGEGVTCLPFVNMTPNDVGNCYHLKDIKSMAAATANLVKHDTILTFIHLNAADLVGHKTCWGCPEYYKSLTLVETKIRFLMHVLKQKRDSSGKPMLDDTLIVIVSDHGGWRDTHLFDLPFSALVDIPILIRGPGVLQNNNLENSYVSNLDVAATVLNAIGVEKSDFMRGQVLEQIYP